MDPESRIVPLEEVPSHTTFLFTVRDLEAGERKEAILVGVDGEIAAWLNYCQHLLDIRLDKGSGAEMRNGEIICTNHGAYFQADTGLCTYGPCEGAYLTELEIAVADGWVYLTDDDHEFVSVGPIERDDLDRASESNVEF